MADKAVYVASFSSFPFLNNQALVPVFLFVLLAPRHRHPDNANCAVCKNVLYLCILCIAVTGTVKAKGRTVLYVLGNFFYCKRPTDSRPFTVGKVS